MRGAIRGGAGVVRGGREGFVAETGAGGFGEVDCCGGFIVLVLCGLGERGLGGAPVLAGESDLGETVGFHFSGVPVVCGERRLGFIGGGRDKPEVPSKGFAAGD